MGHNGWHKEISIILYTKKTPLNAITFDVKIEDGHLWLKTQ